MLAFIACVGNPNVDQWPAVMSVIPGITLAASSYRRRLLKIKMISFPGAALLVSFVDSFIYMYMYKLNVTLCRCFQQKDEEPSPFEHKWTGRYRLIFVISVLCMCDVCSIYNHVLSYLRYRYFSTRKPGHRSGKRCYPLFNIK